MGVEIALKEIPSRQNLTDTKKLYSESAGRFIVTIDPSKKEDFESLFSGMRIKCVGTVNDSNILKVAGSDGTLIIEEDVIDLKECWKKTFGELV